jgi:hypothetical protein
MTYEQQIILTVFVKQYEELKLAVAQQELKAIAKQKLRESKTQKN